MTNGQELTDGTDAQDVCDYEEANQVIANVTANWNDVDCDGDGVPNGQEITDGTAPQNPCEFNIASITLVQSSTWNDMDCDGDGVTNGDEVTDGTDVNEVCDYNPVNQVVANVTADWNNADCDGDGVINGQEVMDGTNPNDPCEYDDTNVTVATSAAWDAMDCDNDGLTNGEEITGGSNPLDICDPLSPILNPTATYTLNADCSPSGLQLEAGINVQLGQITSIEWTGPNGWTAFIENPVIANVTENYNGNYVVNVTDENGCTASAVIDVQGILNSVAFPQITGDGSVCTGEEIILSIPQYQGSSSVIYNWTYPGTGANISGLGTNEITINPILNENEGDYTVEVIVDNNCVLQSNPYPVVVHEVPVVAVTNDATECILPQTDLNLTSTITGGSGTYEVLWTGPNGFTSSNMNVVLPNATSSTSGTYTITVTDLNGCSVAVSTVVDVTVTPETPILTVADNTLCFDDILALETQAYNGADVNYTWVFNGAIPTTYTTTIPSLTILDVDITHQGVYSVYVTVDGCTSLISAAKYISITPQPAMPIVVANIDVCEGGDIILTTSTDAQHYEWTGPNGFTSNLKTPNVIVNASSLNGGEYVLVVDYDGCVSEPATVTVSVEDLPQVPILQMSNSLCEGEEIVLTAIGNAAASYQWISPSNTVNGYFGNLSDPNNVIWTAGNTTVISPITHPQFYESGTWSVRAISANGCVSELSVGQQLSINEVPFPPIANNNGPKCVAEPVQLFADPVPNANYRWHDGDPYASPAGTIISTEKDPIISGLPAGIHEFYLTVQVSGCEPTVAAKTEVEIIAKPVVNFISNTGPYCAGSAIQLNAPTMADATYLWTGPNGFSSFIEDPVISDADGLDEGVYTLVVTTQTALCASEAMTTNVFVTPIPETPTVANNGPACEGENLQLFGSDVPVGNDVIYQWTGPNGYVSNFQNPIIPNLSTTDEGNYILEVTVNGCTSLASASTIVAMNNIPQVPVAENNTTISSPACEGGGIELEAEFIQGATYQWYGPNGYESTEYNPIVTDANSTDEGEYTVFVTINGCTSEAGTTNAFVQMTPEVPIATNSGPVCIGEDLILSVTNTDASATYIWYDSLTNEFIGNGNLVTLTNANASTAGTFYVIATINGCESDVEEILPSGEDAYAEVVIDLPSPDEAYAGEDQVVCENMADINASPVTIWNGGWTMMNNQSDVEIINPNEQSTLANELEVGNNIFLWSITSGACGITSQDTMTVTYQIDPETEDDDYEAVINTRLTENIMSNDIPNTDSFLISIVTNVSNGELTLNSDGTMEYTPSQGFVGTDQFTYIVCNAHCLDKCSESTVTIEVGRDTECVIPEVMTPNNDGLNDAFIVPCLDNYDENVLGIYNRWGDEVYHDEDYKNDWAGTFKGEHLPVGTYYYVLKINDGNNTVKKGYLFIQR